MSRIVFFVGFLVVASCDTNNRAAINEASEKNGQTLTNWKTTPQSTKPNRPATESERQIVVSLKRFFESADATERQGIVRRILADKAYDPSRVSDLLHSCALHKPLQPGLQRMDVALENDANRAVTVRIPRGYTPERRWPLILAYHYTGGSGEDIINILTPFLGDRVDDFVIAASTDYLPLNVDSKRSWMGEQRLVLRQVKKLAHIDSDRVYATGFSQGGYAAWSYAVFYGDELAGAAPVACTFDAAPEIPGLWELLMPNVANVPMLHVWGSDDNLPVLGFDLSTVVGTAANLNERVTDLTRKLGLNILNYRVRGGRHAYEPPSQLLATLLENRRVQYPLRVQHRFRYLVQGRAYWLEPVKWDGDQWGLASRQLSIRSGATREQIIGEMISGLLGEVNGEVSAQKIRLEHKHVAELIVWFGDGMIDFGKPVSVVANNQTVFEGEIKRDLYVCLTQAARTYDFDRLRWAGLRVTREGKAEWLTDKDNLPELIADRPN